MERSGVTGKSLHQVSASRRDASVVDAMSCTTESSLRVSFIIYHAYPTTPLRSMAGYFQRALTGSDWENMIYVSYLNRIDKSNLTNKSECLRPKNSKGRSHEPPLGIYT